jgi:hypothetical protein
MATDELDLVALRRPCFFRLPGSDRRAALRFYRAPEKKMLEAWQADPNNSTLLLGLLRAAIPDITDEELNDLSVDEDIPRIIAKANGKAAIMELMLKNAESGGMIPVPSPTPPSTPTTTSSTSSAASRKRTGSGRGNSSKRSGTKFSSPTTG